MVEVRGQGSGVRVSRTSAVGDSVVFPRILRAGWMRAELCFMRGRAVPLRQLQQMPDFTGPSFQKGQRPTSFCFYVRPAEGRGKEVKFKFWLWVHVFVLVQWERSVLDFMGRRRWTWTGTGNKHGHGTSVPPTASDLGGVIRRLSVSGRGVKDRGSLNSSGPSTGPCGTPDRILQVQIQL